MPRVSESRQTGLRAQVGKPFNKLNATNPSILVGARAMQ